MLILVLVLFSILLPFCCTLVIAICFICPCCLFHSSGCYLSYSASLSSFVSLFPLPCFSPSTTCYCHSLLLSVKNSPHFYHALFSPLSYMWLCPPLSVSLHQLLAFPHLQSWWSAMRFFVFTLVVISPFLEFALPSLWPLSTVLCFTLCQANWSMLLSCFCFISVYVDLLPRQYCFLFVWVLFSICFSFTVVYPSPEKLLMTTFTIETRIIVKAIFISWKEKTTPQPCEFAKV